MNLYHLRITLAEIEPPIWRRLEIDGDSMLSELHDAIQCVMGWEDYHMHLFTIGKKQYGPFGEEGLEKVLDEDEFTLNELVKPKTKIRYCYDLGDNWIHEIVVENVLEMNEEFSAPRCLDGARACPPEDCGGAAGYLDKLIALSNPKHEDHEEIVEWLGDFNPDHFSVDEANAALRELAEGEDRLIKELIDEGLLPDDDDDDEIPDFSNMDDADFGEYLEEHPMLDEMLQRFLLKLGREWGTKSEKETMAKMASLKPRDVEKLQKELIENDPVESAQSLALLALSGESSDDVVSIAEQALQLDPRNVDARLLQILSRDKPEVELIVAVRTLTAEAEQAIPKDALEHHHGTLSQYVLARPYLRAASALVSLLAKTGHVDEAITFAEKTLERDQPDAVLLRPRLAILLLTSRQIKRAGEILKACDTDHEAVQWARVLERHLSDDLQGAEEALRNAQEANPHVAKYLTTNVNFDEMTDDMEEEEFAAWIAADIIGSAWRGSPKSIEWLRKKTT